MNNKVNYTLVGVLVLVGTFLMFAFSYWMLKPSSEKETEIYVIEFDESVFGLNVEAPVKYRGISVGKVSNLRINPRNSEQVEVQISVLKSTPIKENTVARLTAQGITGLTYINLSLGENKAPKLVAKDGEEYPVIKTVPSFFENFEQSLGSVTGKLSRTLGKTEELLGEQNQKNMAIILARTANVSKKIDILLDDKTIGSLQSSAKNLESITYKVDHLIPNVNKLVDNSIEWQDSISTSFNSIMNSYLGIRDAMDEINRAVASGEFNLKEISAEFVPTMNTTFIQMQDLMIRVEDALEQYKRSPADILYKEEKIKKAPGE
jgi:phospholipid/cholesterol/gamma-HCH transport system substrate-binding protein